MEWMAGWLRSHLVVSLVAASGENKWTEKTEVPAAGLFAIVAMGGQVVQEEPAYWDLPEAVECASPQCSILEDARSE